MALDEIADSAEAVVGTNLKVKDLTRKNGGWGTQCADAWTKAQTKSPRTPSRLRWGALGYSGCSEGRGKQVPRPLRGLGMTIERIAGADRAERDSSSRRIDRGAVGVLRSE